MKLVNKSSVNDLGEKHAGPDLYCDDYRFLSNRDRLCARVRKVAVRSLIMSVETILGLAASALLLVYLAYALLRPEKF